MKVLGLIICVLLVLVFGIISAIPYSVREVRSPVPAISASYANFPSVIRKARASEELNKDDLEGSETAVIAYPYWSWPSYHGYYAPHVVYVGK